VEQVGPDRVRVTGARGSAPTTSYKATATYQDGHRAMATAMFSGVEAAGRARRTGEALVARTERLLASDGFTPLLESSVEVIGGGETFGMRTETAVEAVLKVGVRHPDKAAVDVFAQEFAPFGLVAQGMTGVFAGRPRVAPVFRVFHLLVDKAATPVTVSLGPELIAVTVAPGVDEPRLATPTLGDAPGNGGVVADVVEVPLRQLAWARSGDKGDRANIGVIARRPEFLPVIRDQVTAARVAKFFAHYAPGDVQRWELPGVGALNFLIDSVLGGSGGTSTLRYDPQGKSYGAMLLTLPIKVPRTWDLEPVSPASAVAA
jgi:hypothetical protein